MVETLIVPGFGGLPAGHRKRDGAEDVPSAAIVEQQDRAGPDLIDRLHALQARIEARAPHVIRIAHGPGGSNLAALARPVADHVGAPLAPPALRDLGVD